MNGRLGEPSKEMTFKFILEGRIGDLHLKEFTGTIMIDPATIGSRVSVEIEQEEIWYRLPLEEHSNLTFYISEKLGREWNYQNGMHRLVAKDAIRVMKKRENSLFLAVPNLPQKSFLVSQNEVLNALKSERRIFSNDHAELLGLFLQAFEENQHVNLDMLYLSTNFIQEEIERKVNYYERRRFITRSASGYTIDEHQADMIEKRVKPSHSLSSESTPTLPHRYFNPVKVRTDRRMAFIGMPFKGSDEKYQVIDDVCRSNGYLAFRIDRDPNFEIFLNKVAGYVLASTFCLFDITGSNPNVLLELGVALTTEKNIIVIADEHSYEEEIKNYQRDVSTKLSDPELKQLEDYLKSAKIVRLIPADVRERPVILYKNLDQLKSSLEFAIKQIS
jgi:hypothetical protein